MILHTKDNYKCYRWCGYIIIARDVGRSSVDTLQHKYTKTVWTHYNINTQKQCGHITT